MKTICVFLSAEDSVVDRYGDCARDLGKELAKRQLTLLYGGGSTGLMGVLAQAVRGRGGSIISVIPNEAKHKPIWYEDVQEIVHCPSLKERIAEMAIRSDAFIVLPGGLGTLNEISEIQLGFQLGLHQKPFVYLNTHGFYDSLKGFYAKLFSEGFAHARYREMIHFAADPRSALDYLTENAPTAIAGKWIEK